MHATASLPSLTAAAPAALELDEARPPAMAAWPESGEGVAHESWTAEEEAAAEATPAAADADPDEEEELAAMRRAAQLDEAAESIEALRAEGAQLAAALAAERRHRMKQYAKEERSGARRRLPPLNEMISETRRDRSNVRCIARDKGRAVRMAAQQSRVTGAVEALRAADGEALQARCAELREVVAQHEAQAAELQLTNASYAMLEGRQARQQQEAKAKVAGCQRVVDSAEKRRDGWRGVLEEAEHLSSETRAALDAAWLEMAEERRRRERRLKQRRAEHAALVERQERGRQATEALLHKRMARQGELTTEEEASLSDAAVRGQAGGIIAMRQADLKGKSSEEVARVLFRDLEHATGCRGPTEVVDAVTSRLATLGELRARIAQHEAHAAALREQLKAAEAEHADARFGVGQQGDARHAVQRLLGANRRLEEGEARRAKAAAAHGARTAQLLLAASALTSCIGASARGGKEEGAPHHRAALERMRKRLEHGPAAAAPAPGRGGAAPATAAAATPASGAPSPRLPPGASADADADADAGGSGEEAAAAEPEEAAAAADTIEDEALWAGLLEALEEAGRRLWTLDKMGRHHLADRHAGGARAKPAAGGDGGASPAPGASPLESRRPSVEMADALGAAAAAHAAPGSARRHHSLTVRAASTAALLGGTAAADGHRGSCAGAGAGAAEPGPTPRTASAARRPGGRGGASAAQIAQALTPPHDLNVRIAVRPDGRPSRAEACAPSAGGAAPAAPAEADGEGEAGEEEQLITRESAKAASARQVRQVSRKRLQQSQGR